MGRVHGRREPGDASDGSETGHDEQLAVIDVGATYLFDVRGSVVYGAVCECDHRSISTEAQTFIDNDPNNPN